MDQAITDYVQCGIRSDFLSINNYKATMQFSQKRNDNYLKFCTLIKNYYADFQATSKLITDRIKINPSDSLLSIKHFKQFIIDFVKILEEVAAFKTDYYEQLEQMETDPIRGPTFEMIARVPKYSQPQNKYQDVYRTLSATDDSLNGLYSQLKKEVKDPIVFFDQKYVKGKCSTLQGLIKTKQDMQKEGNEVLDSIYKNTLQFQKEIGFYRQKMLSGKYKVHKKLCDMSRGARECLTQTLLTLNDCATQRYKTFQNITRDQIRESTLLHKFKSRNTTHLEQANDKLPEIIITATQQYNDLIDEVETIIKNLMDGFAVASVNCKHYEESSKLMMEEVNKLYDNDESPTPEMIETLESFHYFCLKIGQIPNLLHIHQANVVKLRQSINKHSQITLSLLKCSPSLKNKVESGSNKSLDQINHLFDQLSYDYINDIIERIYKLMEQTLGHLKNYFNMKYHKKKKNNIEDSMQISHIEDEYYRPQKRPSKKELWLWKEFRNAEKYKKQQSSPKTIEEINKFMLVFSEMKIESQKEVDKFNCSLSTKKETRGLLRILQRNILFNSSNNLIELNIPLDFVEEATVNVKIFQKELTVTTSIGPVVFFHFPQLSKAEVLIQQQLASASSANKTTKKTSVQLSPEQIQFVAKRRENIKSELQSLEGYAEQGSVLIENATLDAVYDMVYSDKPFKYKGKQQCCFLSYILKKSGGSNYTTTKYDPPGPKFYSLEEGKTFINTPLVSERVNDYTVPLPPIPFMPKTCTNTQSVRIYWISDSELDYLIKSVSKGAPYADSFYLNILHKVTKKDKDVEIKVYYKITFVKDTSMRGMISSKSADEVKSKILFLLSETAKLYKVMGGGAEAVGGKETAQQLKEEEEVSTSKHIGSTKVKTLQYQNKILIGVLLAVILINLILRLF